LFTFFGIEIYYPYKLVVDEMMDNTALFRACAKAVQVRLKKPMMPVSSSSSSLNINATSEYCLRAKEIVRLFMKN
jgi:hypothetical protein